MATYPNSLPAPLLEGYALNPLEQTIRTDMETGSARVRRRTFAPQDRVSLQWIFTAKQFAMFRAFVDGEVGGGASWFTMTVDDGVLGYAVPRDVRFVKTFESERVGLHWKVRAEVDIRRVQISTFDHLNLLGFPSLDLDFAGTKGLAPVITSAQQPTPVVTFTRASTATYVDAAGLIVSAAVDEPRFDHDPVTKACKGLLIEEARSNIFFPSDGTGGFGNQAGLTFSPIATPDGTTVNCLWNAEGGNTANRYQKDIPGGTYSTGQKIALSWYQKRVNGAGSGRALFLNTLINATVVTNSTLISAAANGFERWYAVVSITDGAVATTLRLYIASALDLVNSAFAIWGVQVEPGDFATSLIPTTTAAVTRAADVASMTGTDFSSWYRHDEGAMIANANALGTLSASRVLWEASDGTASERLQVYMATTGAVRLYAADGGVAQADVGSANIGAGTSFRAASAYKTNDLAQSVSGQGALSDALASLPTVVRLTIGHRFDNTNQFNGHIARLTYYPKRLANADLQLISGGGVYAG